MSEKLHGHESKHPSLDLSAEVERNLKRSQEAAKETETGHEKLEQTRHRVETEAISGREIHVGEHKQQASEENWMTHRELKANAYKRALHHIRSSLSPSERSFSRFIHQPSVDKASNAASQTIARPYALICAGVVTLVGSTYLVYATKHYGFSYNYGVFGLLFVSGYLLGLLLEGLMSVLTIRRRHRR